MRIHYIKQQLPVFFLCIALFLFPSVMRTAMINRSWMEINYIGWAAILFMYLTARKADNYKPLRLSLQRIANLNLILIALLFVSFGIVTLYRRDFATCAVYVITILFPTFIINFDWKSGAVFERCIVVWVKTLKICCYVIFLGGIIDKISGNAVSYFFANLYGVDSLISNADTGRMVSYLGHALFSTQMFITFYVTQYLYATKFLGENEKLIDVFISIIGVAMTASKSGIVLLLGIIIVFHANWKNRKIVPIVLLGILALYQFGTFDLLIERIMSGIATGDITTGRNAALKNLLTNGTIRFRWFIGKNIDTGWQMTAALEYPVLRWAYQFGIVVSLILCLIVFLLPLIKLLNMKADKAYVFGSLAIMAFVNTYNGIALQRDHMLIYCLTIFFIVNMAAMKPAVNWAENDNVIDNRKIRFVWKPPIWLDEDDGRATGVREENISFGVFGTLIRRSVGRPADLFHIMKQNNPNVPEHFAEKRMEAERTAYAKFGARMGLADIYEELIPLYGNHTNDLMALEIQYEIAGCRPVPENIDLVNLCMEHDKNVFLLADTYLPSSVLRRMLDVCGVYHYDRLYVSCEEGACKADGSLFWKVLADQEIRPHELRHIGSDLQGDVTEPWRVGVHVKRGKKKGQSVVDKELPEDIALYERTLQACIRNCADDLDSDDARLGCETFGPLLAGFTAWLREQLRRDGIQDVYFLAGDGSVMKQAFDALEDSAFRTHSLYFPAQTTEQDHEALLAYLRACGMQGRVALVDTGRQIIVQKTLENLIAEAGLDIQVKGYYMGLADTDGMQAAGYLYERDKGAETLEKLSPIAAIFDTVFHAQHGAVHRIVMRDGQPVPELDAYEYASDEGRICDEIAILRAYQAGALTLVREMNGAFPGGVPQIPGEAAIRPLLRMGTKPTRQEAELWGDFRVFEGGKAILMAWSKGVGAYLLHPGQLKRDYAASPWKIGFLRRLSRLPLAYDKIAKNG